jgi:hypothetical protein
MIIAAALAKGVHRYGFFLVKTLRLAKSTAEGE